MKSLKNRLFDKDTLNNSQMGKVLGGLEPSHVHTDGDCEIDSGDACDWTTIDPDCPPADLPARRANGVGQGRQMSS